MPFEGIVNNLERRYNETDSPTVREELAKYLNGCTCPECKGTRLRLEARHVRVADKNHVRDQRAAAEAGADFFPGM